MNLESTEACRDLEGWTGSVVLRRLRVTCLVVVSLTLMTGAAAGMLLVAVATLFQARRFYSEVVGKWVGQTILQLWGIKVKLHSLEPFPESQTIYIANHSSTLDIFTLISLALPNTRFFMAGWLRWILPLGAIGYLIQIFWTPLQKYPEKRILCFQAAERELRRTGESVYLSPEGRRCPNGLGPFNKGAFHLATNLKAPILPLYIAVAPEISPGRGFDARPGTVDVYVKPAIQTRDWKIEDLERNRREVHELYLSWEARIRDRRHTLESAEATSG